MNKVIALSLILLASVVAASAQSLRSQNEGVVAYNFLTSDVSVERLNHTRFNTDTDSHGFTVGYTRYTKGEAGKVGVLGLTGEVSANFDSNKATLATVMVGGTVKARNNSVVQPYARVLGGVARQNITRANIADVTDVSAAFDLGAGVDFAVKGRSRYGIGFGVDYLNTGFNGQRQNAYRGSVRLIF